MKVESLFPTPVAFFKFPRTLTTEELTFLSAQEINSNVGNRVSANTNILETDELADIKKFIDICLGEYFKSVFNPKEDVSVYITQSWANYTGSKEWHHKHAHPCSFISGCFYPKATEDVDKITFFKSGYNFFGIPAAEWNTWNSPAWWYPVATGDIILFPSSLEHMVEQKNDNEERISIAFNTFLKGNLGAVDTLTHLGL